MTRHRLTALAILVTALLLQWSWAAAADLCRHDGHQAAHFGHHSHVASLHGPHADAADPQAQAPDGGSAAWGGLDCGCGHACVAVPSLERLAPAAAPPPSALFTEPAQRYDSAAGLRPDRPRWRA